MPTTENKTGGCEDAKVDNHVQRGVRIVKRHLVKAASVLNPLVPVVGKWAALEEQTNKQRRFRDGDEAGKYPQRRLPAMDNGKNTDE